MSIHAHSWRKASKQVGRRSLIGLLIALSLTLVAFEWQAGEPNYSGEYLDPYTNDWTTSILLPVTIEKTTVVVKKSSERASAPSITGSVEPISAEHEPSEIEKAEPGVEPEGWTEPSEVDHATTPAPMPAHWNLVSVKPHFEECMKRGIEYVDACTEERIGKHLERRFRVPSSLKGSLRTTITFEIDEDGKIGKLVCTPRVPQAIEAEIERVIRSLPQFVPGRQGDHIVPVYYQIPLSVVSA